MTTGTITLPPQLLNPLHNLASERGRSVDAPVQDLIGEFLREQCHT
ncbi:MAG: hypothetical protein HY784_06600, partial [Chloroflexi bacterium]|nr:hypothetical protein [Chloroflexota bacterium]